MGYHFVERETSPLSIMFLAVYSQHSAGKAILWSWMEGWGCVPMSLPCLLCPASQLQPSSTINQTFELKMCLPVLSLRQLCCGMDTSTSKTIKELTAIIFFSHHHKICPSPPAGIWTLFQLQRPLLVFVQGQMYAVLSPRWQTVRGPCKSQPLLLPAHGNTADCFWFCFFNFCLNLSRLNIAAWDTKDKIKHLFTFHCNVEMFSHRLKSQSLLTLQASSRQCCWRWPGAHYHINQRTKKLQISLQQLQPKCKTSNNRWDQTDGGVKGKKWGNIRECDRQESQHISSLAVVKFLL